MEEFTEKSNQEQDLSNFSRYNGEADVRGESMVARHVAKQRAESQARQIAMLKKALPKVDEKTIRAALENSKWDEDGAFRALRAFLGSEIEKKALKHEDKRESKDKKRKREKEGDESDSASGSDGSDESASEDSDADDKKRSKKSKRKKSDKDKKSKKEKKHKKAKGKEKEKASKLAAVKDAKFGKYGVIKESDMWNKKPEFGLWCSEVKQVNIEGLAKWEEKDLFREYAEDYNTASLPDKKYYDYEAWEIKRRVKEARRGANKAKEEKTSFNDEDDRRAELMRDRQIRKHEEVLNLRKTLVASGVVDDMREQEQLKALMQQHYRTGDMDAARALAQRLAPDDPAELLQKGIHTTVNDKVGKLAGK
ncbi:hypothetical protein CYMTET_44992 [Cymbomonas tetramitiformis]|uniref:Uncharacterized protein n=1 Tax=Cymbomonas tetramitiformis TaxID=36881 RepID=A0AAE0EZ15_9CHLO|nr:hypothetical protein CYMTET_44992 [Cymbomonas tetramitiformis]